jgi:effector-binding domain-containing protein
MKYDVEVVEADARPTAAVSATVTPNELARRIPGLFDTIYGFLRAENVAHLGLNVITYFDESMRIEAGVLVPQAFVQNGLVVNSATPAGFAATTLHIGEYSDLGGAYEAIHEWSRTSSYELSSPSWELYGHWSDDPSKRLTEVFYLLKPKH